MYRQLNGKREGFARTNSICPTPEEVLLKSVLKNEVRNITRIVESSPNLLSHIYGAEYNKPILLIACSEERVKAETVKTLIDLGADLYYSSDIDEEWQALHFAAYSTKSETLRVVVENLRNPGDINILAKGSNALHILIRYGKNDSLEQFVECAKILVREGIDVNQGDGDDVSPILWAAKKGFKEIIKVILESSDIPVDIDSHKSRKDTARDIIQRKNLYDGILPDKNDNQNDSDANILFKYLHSKNENAFLNFKGGDIFDLVNADNTSSTLLQVSCEKRLKRAAEHLINKGADPNSTTSKNRKTPIEITTDNGCYEIFDILLDHPKTRVPKSVLVTLLKNIDNEELPGISHSKCYDILLEKLHKHRDLIDINETDESKNSPLHYAVRYSDPEKVENLLQLGASLGSKNKYGVMPIQDIEPEVLEKHLDSCIQFDLKGKKFEKEDFSITFNYNTIIPPSEKIEYNVAFENSDPETNLNHIVTRELVTETEVISYMSKAPEFRYLLKHPVVVSFLFVKWHCIRWLFYTNLAFYIAFVLSLVVYIFVWYANFSNTENSSFENFVANLSYGIFFLTYIILIFRELFQMTVSPNKYFRNFENYVEIILIFFTGCILFVSNPVDDTRRILSSVSILLAAFELVLMVGQHPKLSTNVVMLETVSLNFFKFLMWYSLLIIAFALSFYILFSEAEVDNKNNTENDDGEEDFFTDPGKSMFKTIVMLTGEFDAGSLNFHHFPITSKIMFALFIFMIAIILLNLLNGLAVSDTQQIKNNAELVGHIARAQHIRYVESMLLGNILPKNIFKRINDFCCCFSEASNCNFRISKPLAKKACLFPHYLDYKLTVYPNKYGQIYLEKRQSIFGKNCIGSCAYIYLDKETIKRTNRIIQERREALKVKKEDNQIRRIENIVKILAENAGNDRKEISELNIKLDDIIRHINVENDQ
ncbi:transient receptor potential cation channel protein painless [Anoplophora glabripennis]|uniref:transient receptor potential cation channel protein painless n=1 Tax=Anoplophora glabripennis TaxID=217634 RepID=UPI000875415C|nr:transient receptor potential cation channel protein painless [Anoplophora glabripennis]XP_018573376.1 transient receptor potential cation channel protein painless [Anoplophora glabripennis]